MVVEVDESEALGDLGLLVELEDGGGDGSELLEESGELVLGDLCGRRKERKGSQQEVRRETRGKGRRDEPASTFLT